MKMRLTPQRLQRGHCDGEDECEDWRNGASASSVPVEGNPPKILEEKAPEESEKPGPKRKKQKKRLGRCLGALNKQAHTCQQV